jgi:HAMP domain-containing protein
MTPRYPSLRAKLLGAVVLCAVIPLAAVSVWLTMSVSRAGENLLLAQLDSAVSRAVHSAVTRWEYRQADVALLADNEPVRVALGSTSAQNDDEASRFLERAFESMTGVGSAIIRDDRGRPRWLVGVLPRGDGVTGRPQRQRDVVLERFIFASNGRDTVGRVEARIRLDGLLGSPSAPLDVGPGLVAIHSRSNDEWLLPGGISPEMLAALRFKWEGGSWLAVKRSVDDPALDVYAAAPSAGFSAALARATGTGALALGIVALLVVLLTVIVTGRITGSLTRLAQAADAVSRGDLETRIEIRSHDEVGRVARTFNQMTENLRAMMR